jgi:hypothetical protein
MYYEYHITIKSRYIQTATALSKNWGFKVSEIAGDEVLGGSKLGYITFRRKTLNEAFDKMEQITRIASFPIIRRKIEHIIYDSYTDHAEGEKEKLRHVADMASDIPGEPGPREGTRS